MALLGDSDRVDGSWELNILVTDLQVERTLRVMGDLHIGGVMVKLVEALGRLIFLSQVLPIGSVNDIAICPIATVIVFSISFR